MKKILIFFISLYQKTPFSYHSYCRMVPTCSNYAKESIEVHGAFKGSILAIKRIISCNPLNDKIYDPVPIKEK